MSSIHQNFDNNKTYTNTPEISINQSKSLDGYFSDENKELTTRISKVTVIIAYKIDENLPVYEESDDDILRERIRQAFEQGRNESDLLVEKIHMQGSSSFEDLPTLLSAEESLERFSRETSGFPSSHSSRTVRFDLSSQELTKKVQNSNHYSPKFTPKAKKSI